MRQFLNKAVTVMLVAFLALSLSACGGDSEEDNDLSTGKGKMSGWVKIDGKKYEFNYFYGGYYLDGEYGFTGFSIDPYNLKEKKHFNIISSSLGFKEDGSIDFEDGYPCVAFEISIDYMPDDTSDMVMYSNDDDNLSYDVLTATKSGNKVTIDGKNVQVRYSHKGDDYIGTNAPVTTIDFHFEGTPTPVEAE